MTCSYHWSVVERIGTEVFTWRSAHRVCGLAHKLLDAVMCLFERVCGCVHSYEHLVRVIWAICTNMQMRFFANKNNFQHSSVKQDHTCSGSNTRWSCRTLLLHMCCAHIWRRSARQTKRFRSSSDRTQERLTSAEHARYISGAYITVSQVTMVLCFLEAWRSW